LQGNALALQDLVRMADATMATRARKQVEAQSGSATLAARMVPPAANEGKYLDIAARLYAALFPEQVDGAVAGERAAAMVPTGLPDLDPRRIQKMLQDGIARLQALLPRIQNLAGHPVVQQMVMAVVSKTAQRGAARSVKFVFVGASSLRQDMQAR
jgi:hypothetical protein